MLSLGLGQAEAEQAGTLRGSPCEGKTPDIWCVIFPDTSSGSWTRSSDNLSLELDTPVGHTTMQKVASTAVL